MSFLYCATHNNGLVDESARCGYWRSDSSPCRVVRLRPIWQNGCWCQGAEPEHANCRRLVGMLPEKPCDMCDGTTRFRYADFDAPAEFQKCLSCVDGWQLDADIRDDLYRVFGVRGAVVPIGEQP